MQLDHKVVYPLLAIGAIACIVAMWVGDEATITALAVEDGPIETASALLWAAGALCCVIAVVRRAFFPYNVLWLVVCVAALGEETSWFQRYLGYSVPVVEGVNKQSEFNIHNLDMFPGATTQVLFILGLLGWFLVLPLALRLRPIYELGARIRIPDPTVTFAISMWTVVAISYLPVASTQALQHPVRETREMLYAFFVLVYVFGFAVRHVGAFATWPPFVPGSARADGSRSSTADPIDRPVEASSPR